MEEGRPGREEGEGCVSEGSEKRCARSLPLINGLRLQANHMEIRLGRFGSFPPSPLVVCLCWVAADTLPLLHSFPLLMASYRFLFVGYFSGFFCFSCRLLSLMCFLLSCPFLPPYSCHYRGFCFPAFPATFCYYCGFYFPLFFAAFCHYCVFYISCFFLTPFVIIVVSVVLPFLPPFVIIMYSIVLLFLPPFVIIVVFIVISFFPTFCHCRVLYLHVFSASLLLCFLFSYFFPHFLHIFTSIHSPFAHIYSYHKANRSATLCSSFLFL